MIQPYRFACRQCPQNKWLNPNLITPDYTCKLNQNHILCQCCLEAMPDRNDEININNSIPKQNCSLCFRSFCNLYWGCRKDTCKSCLVKFVDFKVDNSCLINLINDNQYESKIFSDWLTRSKKEIQNIFDECIAQFKNGIFQLQNFNQIDLFEKIVCQKCGIMLFKSLAYQYRLKISNNEFLSNFNFFLNNLFILTNNFLKGHVRPDCHWGKNCRTQRHNLEHAKYLRSY